MQHIIKVVRYPVEVNGKWGYITVNGHSLMDINYDQAGPYSNNQAWVEVNNNYLIIDNSGIVLKEYTYEEVEGILSFSANLYLFEKDGRYGYLDNRGIVINAIYDEASPFDNGAAFVTLKNISYFIDINGEVINFNNDYKVQEDFSEGLALVSNGNEYGYINRSGNLIIPFSKHLGSSFSEGMAFIFNSKIMKYGYINTSGTEVINSKYDAALPFVNGLAFVREGKEAKVIDINENIRYSLPEKCSIDVDSYLKGLLFYNITVDGKELVINRMSGEIRSFSE
ncbi:WG repeat-containing protein [Paenibacillus glycanilyticus]|uniref:WG repeat-containing protein n=1 Tax=Paenibacillus glycanilyticus TaxID=126569 RepID=UPI0013E2C72D|nr:WG repeat-containing protein [Paenibacillus glycanilyticus]